MNDMEPQHNLMPPGEKDHEGAMAKADLFKLANYSVKLFKKIDDNDQLESWVQAKITKAADYIASVYHYLEYEMKFSEFGAKLENSEMYSESEKQELKNKLNEAKEMLRTLKLAQAQKLEEAKSPKAKKDWDKDGKIESEKDEVIGSRRKAAGLDESQDDDDEDDDSGYDRDDPKHPKWAERQREKADLARKEKKEKDVSESWDDDDEDDDVKRADSELKKRGVKLPKVKHKEVPVKKTKQDREEEELDEVYGQGVYESYDDDDEDDDVKRADSELKKRGVKLPKVKHKEVPIKKTAKDKEEELDEGSKPDFLDLDKDGNKKEPMKKSARQAEKAERSKKSKDAFNSMFGGSAEELTKDLKIRESSTVKSAIKRAKNIEESENDPDRSPPPKVHGKAASVVDRNDSGDDKHWWDDDPDAVRAGNELKRMGKGWSPVSKKPKTEKPKEKETVKESADLARMKEFLTRLNG